MVTTETSDKQITFKKSSAIDLNPGNDGLQFRQALILDCNEASNQVQQYSV
jgi:hypothetical protein